MEKENKMKSIYMLFRQHLWLVVLGLLFIGLRLPGIFLPYHQDEWKTAYGLWQGTPEALSGLHHPPLTQIIFRLAGSVLSVDYLRIVPLVFSVLTLFLFFIVMRRLMGSKVAYVAILLFVGSFYSVFASLLVDTDGAILPFGFLATVYCYICFNQAIGRKRFWWGAAIGLCLMLGLMVKLSFILVVGVVFIDWLFSRWGSLNKKKVVEAIILFLTLFVVSSGIVFAVAYFYPAFDLEMMIFHAKSYAKFSDRHYLQTIIQAIKAVFYLSPLLIVPLFWIPREAWLRLRVFVIYLVLGGLFYFVFFDFSSGALDKYLMFSVLPLAALAGASLCSAFYQIREASYFSWFVAVGVSVSLFIVNFLPHKVLSLYPKTLWFSNVISGHWMMLNPFTGGNGPLGFYVSFLFIVACFLVCALAFLLGWFRPAWRRELLLIGLSVGIVYNGVFIEEFLFGRINGSAPVLLRQSLDYIKNNNHINKVITANDAGAYELSVMGKYAGRFYPAPAYESVHKERFSGHKGHFLVINIPAMNQDSFYVAFFAKCDSLFETKSGVIESNVYICSENSN